MADSAVATPQKKAADPLRHKSRRYIESIKKQVQTAVSVEAAIELLRNYKPTKFDQSVELIFKLGIDDKQADQKVRGAVSLPNGIGKNKRVVAFVGENMIPAATAAGAIKAGAQSLVEEVEKTNFTDFDVAIASPDMMRFVGKLGKVLGPKGLMPSPKAGTVTADVATAIREFAAGKSEIKNDSGGNLHTVVGKLSFDSKKLAENIRAMIEHVRRLKPQTAKGTYIQKVILKSSMSPAVFINVT